VIGASQVWQIASAWVDWIATGLEKNSPRMHDMIAHLATTNLDVANRRAVTEQKIWNFLSLGPDRPGKRPERCARPDSRRGCRSM
jgi:hypothetical protein